MKQGAAPGACLRPPDVVSRRAVRAHERSAPPISRKHDGALGRHRLEGIHQRLRSTGGQGAIRDSLCSLRKRRTGVIGIQVCRSDLVSDEP